MTLQPLVSVIMPVFNSEAFLAASINSVLSQTYAHFEFIILNDKSTDNSKQIIEQFAATDSRIVFVDKQQNVGPANLRNEGFSLAKGEFIALLDSDDIALPERFEKQVSYLQNHPEVGVCGTGFTFFGAQDKVIRHSEQHDAIKVSFLHSCNIGNPTVMLRRSVLKDFKFDNEYVPVEDYDLWSRLLTQTKFHNLPESLLNYRQHDCNISKTKIDNVNRSIRKVKINQLGNFGILADDSNIEAYLNAVSLQKKLDPESVLNAIRSGKHLLEQNKKLGNYNQQLLQKHIDRTLLRSIRNAKKYNFDFLRNLKRENKMLYKKIQPIDKIILLAKALLG